ncbi:hypothetical protein [Streptomyces sp. NPDC005773]
MQLQKTLAAFGFARLKAAPEGSGRLVGFARANTVVHACTAGSG